MWGPHSTARPKLTTTPDRMGASPGSPRVRVCARGLDCAAGRERERDIPRGHRAVWTPASAPWIGVMRRRQFEPVRLQRPECRPALMRPRDAAARSLVQAMRGHLPMPSADVRNAGRTGQLPILTGSFSMTPEGDNHAQFARAGGGAGSNSGGSGGPMPVTRYRGRLPVFRGTAGYTPSYCAEM